MAMCMHIAFDASAHSCTRVSECPPGHTQLIISYRIIWYYLFSFSHLFFSFQFVCSNMCKLRIYRTYLDGLITYYTDEPTNRPIDRHTTYTMRFILFIATLATHTHIFQSCESHFRRAISHWIRKRFFYKNRTLKTCVRACWRDRVHVYRIFFLIRYRLPNKKAVTEVIGPKIHAKNQNRLDVMTILSPSAHKYVIMSTETIFTFGRFDSKKEMEPLKQPMNW